MIKRKRSKLVLILEKKIHKSWKKKEKVVTIDIYPSLPPAISSLRMPPKPPSSLKKIKPSSKVSAYVTVNAILCFIN